MRTLILVTATFFVAGLSGPANCELVVGGSPPGAGTSHPLSQFARNAQGNSAPIRQIDGPATQLYTPTFGVYEPLERVIYVADFFGQAIRVFPAFASGDVAPVRVINPPLLGQARASAPVPAHDELLAIASSCCIVTFPLLANGNTVATLRTINWGGSAGSLTQLNNPLHLTYFPNTDEVAVVDFNFDIPYNAKIVFHARTTTGNTAPTRVLQSINTSGASGIAHDPVLHRLYVLTSTTPDQLTFSGQIRVFDENASGTDAPLSIIEGPATQLDHNNPQYFSGIGLDRPLQRLMVGVAANGDPSTNRIVVFAQNATGNATPLQLLNGVTLSSGTIGTPFAVPTETIFANGFEN